MFHEDVESNSSLSHLLDHGTELDNQAQARAEEFHRQVLEAFQDRSLNEETEKELLKESPTGQICTRCGMPATKYQVLADDMATGAKDDTVALLCGVCSELSKITAHRMAETDSSYDEWSASVESDETKVGLLTPEVQKRVQESRIPTCDWDACRNDVHAETMWKPS